MQERLKLILEESKKRLQEAASVEEAEEVRIKVLGKKGQLTEILRSMGKLAPEERKELGLAANQVRADIEKMLDAKVNLKIWVKVRKEWRDNTLFLNELGYKKQK